MKPNKAPQFNIQYEYEENKAQMEAALILLAEDFRARIEEIKREAEQA